MSELSDYKKTWENCTKCSLSNSGRSKVIFSDGPESARVMIVGEAPGAIEDQKGIPFSGPAGMLMNKIINVAGLKREDIYWTNTVRCKPPGNRTPLAPETAACKPLLDKEIELIKPRLIIVTGLTAAKVLCKISSGIGKVAGIWTNYKSIPAIIVYHPAAVLHTQDRDPDTCYKYRVSLRDSMLSIKEFLAKPEEAHTTSVEELAVALQQELNLTV